ncbi:MAG: FecR domain-containing protein [Akkermansiaceae bacterium]|nr:FecR domain-containing protein [Akkermansiaceae bacterium]
MKGKELETAILDLLDGRLHGKRAEKLHRLLLNDAEARSLYLSYVRLHGALETSDFKQPIVDSWELEPTDQPQPKRHWNRLSWSIAALIMVGLGCGIFLLNRGTSIPETLHAYEPGKEAVFTVRHQDGKAKPAGKFLTTGSRLTIESGKVECWINQGIHAVIEGPADLIVQDTNRIDLSEGKAWFQVAEGAEGFTVRTPEAEIVDLGTEFGIIVGEIGEDEVHVFQGRVSVKGTGHSKPERLLLAGNSCSIRESGELGDININRRALFASLSNNARMAPPKETKHKKVPPSALATQNLPEAAIRQSTYTRETASFQTDDYLQVNRRKIRFTSSRDFHAGNPGLFSNGGRKRDEFDSALTGHDGVDETHWDFIFGAGENNPGFTLANITIHGGSLDSPTANSFRKHLEFELHYSTVDAPDQFKTLVPGRAYRAKNLREGEGMKVTFSFQPDAVAGIHTLRFVISDSPANEKYSSAYSEIDINGNQTVNK